MAWSLPPQLQTANGETHTFARYPDRVLLLQIVGQQRSGPDGRAIAQLARVASNDLEDQRIDDAMYRAGAARAMAHRQARRQIPGTMHLEVLGPIVDRLARHTETPSDLLNAFACVEPQQRLGPAQCTGMQGTSGKIFQTSTLLSGKRNQSHRSTPRLS
jgi:hypothetical protein